MAALLYGLLSPPFIRPHSVRSFHWAPESLLLWLVEAELLTGSVESVWLQMSVDMADDDGVFERECESQSGGYVRPAWSCFSDRESL